MIIVAFFIEDEHIAKVIGDLINIINEMAKRADDTSLLDKSLDKSIAMPEKNTADIETAMKLLTPPGDGHKQKKRKKKKYHRFTEEEEIFIVKNYGKKTEAEIAKELGLTRKQIEQKIYWMKRTGKWDKIQSAIKEKPSRHSSRRQKYLPAVVCNDRNCQD